MAGAKGALEKLFAGSTVMKGLRCPLECVLSHSESLIHLKQQSDLHQLYIYRNTRKSRLLAVPQITGRLSLGRLL